MPDDKDNIPPGVTSYLDDVAQHLRELNGGKRIPIEWTRYLSQGSRKSVAKKRGRPPHPQREEITARLVKVALSEERGSLRSAIEEAANAYGVDERTLESWAQQLPAAAAIIRSRVLLAMLTDQVDRMNTVHHLARWWRAHQAEIKALRPKEMKALKRNVRRSTASARRCIPYRPLIP